ncbi:MAG: hypothetical protein K2G90_00675 [Muribaculaceae bacterium]|nr:hypothetical protein [Muribaculaceae bacterium]
MKKAFIKSKMGLIALAFSSLCLCACSSDANEPEPDNKWSPIVLDSDQTAAAQQLMDFYTQYTADAVKTVYQNPNRESDNVIVSPLSASMLLGMLANAVDYDTAKKITDYMGVSDLKALNDLSRILLDKLPVADRKSKLQIANSVWYTNKGTLNPDFSSGLTRNYNALLKSIDFSSNSATGTINNWISSSTNGKFSSFLPTLDTNTIAVLLNTVFFEGKWAEEYFDPQNTVKGVFHGTSGDREVMMMHADDGGGLYSETDKFTLVQYFFGNESFCLYLVLPVDDYTETGVIPALTPEDMQLLYDNARGANGTVNLPRFSLGSKISLNDLMACAGIPELSGSLPLSMLSSRIDGVVKLSQGASISLDEEGVTVAAVSEGEALEGASGHEFHLTFDRPFYFFITYPYNIRTCLLSGLVADL